MLKSLVTASLFAITLSTACLCGHAHAACVVTMKVKNPTAKTGAIDGVKLSAKQLAILEKGCLVKREVYSVNELIKMEQDAYQKKIERIKKGAGVTK